MNLTPHHLAWQILYQAEETDFLMSMAQERAACGSFADPAEPGAYLFWLEDEAEIQQAQAETCPDEAPGRRPYAALLRAVAGRLRDLGFTPIAPKKEPGLPVQPGYQAWSHAPRRKGSREVDFGCWWTLDGRPGAFPRWRVSWIERTGELYAAQAQSDRYMPLGVFPTRQEVETALEGWADPQSPLYHHLAALVGKLDHHPGTEAHTHA